MPIEIPKDKLPEKHTGESKWTTVFEINSDAFLEVQRILDILKSNNEPETDPQTAKDEADELYS